MTDSSDESSEYIDFVQRGDNRSCKHTKTYYQVSIQTNVEKGYQVDTETQTSAGAASKDVTQLGATGEVGLSGPVPKAVAKGEGKKQWSMELTGSKSNTDRRSTFATQNLAVNWELVDPNEVDLSDPKIISGCLETTDDGDPCQNHIQAVRQEYIYDVVMDDFQGVGEDMNEVSNRTGLSELENPESPEKGTIGRYVSKAKSGIGTAVSKARSGASTAATKVGSGVSSAVGTIKQRVGSDEQDATQTGAVAPAGGSSTEREMPSREESHDEEARLHVSPAENTEIDTSFDNGAVDLAFTDSETTIPGTRVRVSPDGDTPTVSPGEDGSVTVGLGSDAGTTMAVSPAENDEVDRSFGNGDIQLSLNDGNVRVAPGDNEIQMETGDDGDVQFAVGDAPLTGAPSNDPATGRDTTPDTDRETTSSTPQQTEQNGQPSVRDDAITVTEVTTNGYEPTQTANDKWLGPTPPENRPNWVEQSEEQATDERQNGYDRNNDEGDEDPSRNGGPAGLE